MIKEKPRISAAKLAEYIVARNPARRRTILIQQAEPPIHIVDRYALVSRAVARHIAQGDADAIPEALGLIVGRAQKPRNERHLQRLNDARDALACCKGMELSKNFVGIRVSRTTSKVSNLKIGDVDVVVKPELILQKEFAHEPRVGAAKILVSKTHRLDDDGLAYLGVLLHWFSQEHLNLLGEADSRICGVVDIFGRHYTQAPRAFSKRRAALVTACEEIADRWPKIVERLKTAEKAYEDVL